MSIKKWGPLAGVAFVSLVGLASVWHHRELAASSAQACPAGYELRDPQRLAQEYNPAFAQAHRDEIAGKFGGSVCVSKGLLPESMAEVSERLDDLLGMLGVVPDGAPRRAVQQKALLATQSAQIANSAGHWQAYGTAPQVEDPKYVGAIGDDGIHKVSGRTDSFAYDADHKRLFAAVGNGGIWYTEATGGDLSKLGDHWTSISDALPTLINSAVAWTKAQGGRVLVLTGEHTQGGNAYTGLGAYWSGDLGQTWHHATGVPDAALSFKIAVDPSNPNIVYAATGKGLFRSTDAGASYVNVKLPVSADCAGIETLGACQFANFVTDVVIKQPGGTSKFTCDAKGCPVLAAVGFRSGALPYPDGKPQSPGNGLYRSATGEAGSFAMVGNYAAVGPEPVGFTTRSRIGRIELGNAIGDAQDHGYVYALVQDAGYLNGDIPMLDIDADVKNPALPTPCDQVIGVIVDQSTADLCARLASKIPSATNINGVFVSSDFGDTWTRLADDKKLTYNPATGSSLVPVVALGVGPGVQTWYDMWIKPDPTQADPLQGVPTRLTFGMEEIWKNRLPLPQNGVLQQTPEDYKVFGTYFAGGTCLFLIGQAGVTPSTPVCPTYDGVINGTTTHPDQHDGIYIPDDKGGVWLFVGNDGGIYKQYSADPNSDDFANNKWGDGVNNDRYTFMTYGIAVAKDGTVYYGLQDNASGKIDPKDNFRSVRVHVGDGMWCAVDPDNANVAYYSTPELAVVVTKDGGVTQNSIAPSSALIGTAHFLSPYSLDPLDSKHLVMAGSKVAESLKGADTSSSDSDWSLAFDLGSDAATGAVHTSRSRMLDVVGDAIYAGWCGPCNLAGSNVQFQRGIATNVGGDKPAKKGSTDGWHQAKMAGLPNRYIYSIKIDPSDVRTIYVTLGGYSTARWAPPGQYYDKNANIGSGHVFVSHDAGDSFADVSGDLPDTVVSYLLLRGTQMIVGTDIGVFISSDLSGAHWAPLGDLPNVPVNQLVLKPGDDTQLFAATFGRGVQLFQFGGGTTTGGTTGGTTTGGTTTGGGSGGGGALPLSLLIGLGGLAALRRRRSVH
ncbi:MAG: hypothetical protein E6R07_06705 [Nevskiaceae bacterium]|nr:MAG: hypothetical protein E6R07_06705 [Nevskiaceae bacterium]